MDRQSSFLLALGLLIAAAAFVSATGWFLFVRERRDSRVVPDEDRDTARSDAERSAPLVDE